MSITQATLRVDRGARHPEHPRRAASPESGSPKAQSRWRPSAALIAGLVALGVPPTDAQILRDEPPGAADPPVYLAQGQRPLDPGMGGSAGGVYAPGGAASGQPTVTPIGTTFGVKARSIVASIALTETLTNNVDLTSSDRARSDLVTELVPRLTINVRGAHASLNGFLAAPIVLYARATENDKLYPSIGLLGKVEAVERFFFVEGEVAVTQQYFNPFGGQPPGLANATANRYTAASYRVSPYIQGMTPGKVRYELRNNRLWTNFYGAPATTSNVYYDQWLGTIASPVAPFGWAADFERDWVKFQGQGPLVTNLVRGRLLYQADPQLQLSASGGYEDNRYTLTNNRGAIYGAGFRWTPSPRATLVANWEHRFFGSSYSFAFDERGPLSAIGVRASRGITSYPQQFLSLPATGNVALLLDAIFSSQIPDPVQRQQFIDNLIRDRGLPNSLTSPLNLYAQQILLFESASATLGLLGARNSVFLTGFYARSEPISGAGTPLPPILAGGTNNTQKGVGLNWTRKLTALLTLAATATGLQTVANAPLVGKTNQGIVTVTATQSLSPDTRVFAGARYQKANSDVATDYTEAAIFAGLFYTFK
jgi:uncharacterized protein (PEP-CTERM system associated)